MRFNPVISLLETKCVGSDCGCGSADDSGDINYSCEMMNLPLDMDINLSKVVCKTVSCLCSKSPQFMGPMPSKRRVRADTA